MSAREPGNKSPKGLRAGEWKSPVQYVKFTPFQGEDAQEDLEESRVSNSLSVNIMSSAEKAITHCSSVLIKHVEVSLQKSWGKDSS